MIKKIITVCTLFFAVLCMQAQTPEMQMKITVNGDNVEVKNANGEVVATLSGVLVLPSTAFSNIVFEPKPIDNLKAVELVEGSKVKWATINFKATDQFDVGERFSWNELYGNNGDIVYKTWGEPYGQKWRIPTYDEIIELIRSCDWVWDDENKGYWVYRDKENSPEIRIFLPVTGYLNTEIGKERGAGEGHYWTTDRYDDNKSKELFFSNSVDGEGKDIDAAFLLAVRPVWGDFPVTVTIDNTPSPSNSSVSFQLTLTKDDNTSVAEYGVAYRPSASSQWVYAPANWKGEVTLTGLTANTDYSYAAYYRLTNGSDPILTGGTFGFTTLDYVLTISVGNVSRSNYSTVEIALNIYTDASSQISYGVRYAKKEEWTNEDSRISVAGTEQLTTGNNTPIVKLTGLDPETTYTYEAFASLGGTPQTVTGEFTTQPKSRYPIPERVDLGLSVKWASFNLGANNPGEKGKLFGWGDNTGEMTTINYELYAKGVYGKSISGDTLYDVAAAGLGDEWRIPTREEIKELAKCSWKYVANYQNTGLKGVEISGIGECTGNSIFIPFAGYRRGTSYVDDNQYAYMWSSEVDGGGNGYYYRITGNDMRCDLEEMLVEKCLGMSIRPVYGKSSDPVASKDLTREIVAGSENNTTTGIIPQAAVDMGTTVKWARWNIGVAKRTGELGHYYSWGMTEPLENYDYTSYAAKVPQYDSGHSGKAIKEIDAADDAAAVLWGDSWRMPTAGEFSELIGNCDVEWMNMDGLDGYLFISKTTNDSIFFPAGGYIKGTTTTNRGSEGRYWTKSYWNDDNDDKDARWATTFYYYGEGTEPRLSGIERYAGMLVRPVIPLTGQAREQRLREMEARRAIIEE